MKGVFALSQFVLNAHKMYDSMGEEDTNSDPHQRFSLVEVEITDMRTQKSMCILERVPSLTKISELKDIFEKRFPNYYPSRQSFRLDKREGVLKDSDTLASLNLTNECKLYFDDLGAQIGWRTVFLAQYFPSIFLYLIFYLNWPYKFIWGEYTNMTRNDKSDAVFLACACYCGHFSRRVIETVIINRFNSFTTMRAMRLIKNCTFYWGTTLILAYYINHPLYSSPIYGKSQSYGAFLVYCFSQIGILSIHIGFRRTKTPSIYQYIQGSDGTGSEAVGIPGHRITRLRRGLPQAIKMNPFTWIINWVTCPNYTYELLTWISFCVLTQSAICVFYTIIVSIQMFKWAQQKKHNYLFEFKDYPKNMPLLIPFIL